MEKGSGIRYFRMNIRAQLCAAKTNSEFSRITTDPREVLSENPTFSGQELGSHLLVTEGNLGGQDGTDHLLLLLHSVRLHGLHKPPPSFGVQTLSELIDTFPRFDTSEKQTTDKRQTQDRNTTDASLPEIGHTEYGRSENG